MNPEIFNSIENVENEQRSSFDFTVGVLGDLHLDPRNMTDHEVGRDEIRLILQGCSNPCIVSLGDLGAVKSLTSTDYPLFSGTTACFQLAKEYLDGFGYPYNVIAGNHDLEGLEEFSSDSENLAAFINTLGLSGSNFCRKIADKTLLIGLSTTRFRDSPGSSHEVVLNSSSQTNKLLYTVGTLILMCVGRSYLL